MWVARITLALRGDEFSPSAFQKEINEPHVVWDAVEPGSLKDIEDSNVVPEISSVYEFGSLHLLSPKRLGLPYQLSRYLKWYLRLLKKYSPAFSRHHITEVVLYVEIFCDPHYPSCFGFDRSELQEIAAYNAEMSFDIYRMPLADIKEFLRQEGFSARAITAATKNYKRLSE